MVPSNNGNIFKGMLGSNFKIHIYPIFINIYYNKISSKFKYFKYLRKDSFNKKQELISFN